VLISHVDKQSATKCGKKARTLATDLSSCACCRCVCARLSPNLIAPDHLQGLLEVAAEEAGDKEDSTYLTAVVDLLVGCAASAPALFADLGHQVRPLAEHPICHEDDALFAGFGNQVPPSAEYPICHEPAALFARTKRKEKFTLFSDHNGSLLRRQPGATVCQSSNLKATYCHWQKTPRFTNCLHCLLTIGPRCSHQQSS